MAEQWGHRVTVFGPGGWPEFSFGGMGHGDGQFFGPAGVAFDFSGRIAVADAGNDRVQVFRLADAG